MPPNDPGAVTLRLPARFTLDWIECGSAEGLGEVHAPIVVKQDSRSVKVTATSAALGDLIDRADCYARFEGEDFAENRGLVLSARAVLARFTSDEQRTHRAAYTAACEQ